MDNDNNIKTIPSVYLSLFVLSDKYIHVEFNKTICLK